MEKLKDILYRLVDYIFMILVIGIVAGIIAWRLDILFSKNYAKNPNELHREEEKIEELKEAEVDKKDHNILVEVDNDKNKDNSALKEEEKEIEDDINLNDTVTIEIPKGSVSTTIGDILTDNGLVPDSKSFVDKATELEKETKLKSGTFEIPKNISIEGVIEIITK